MTGANEAIESEAGASAVGIVAAVTPPVARRSEGFRRSRTPRRGIAAGLLATLVSSASLALAEPSPPQAPQQATPSAVSGAQASTQASLPVVFVIEKIVVEGVKARSERIVISETLLTLGSAYTEAQLREALHRIERLPFVVEADFSLRRGSDRGRFELVITVTETWPVFFGGTVDLVQRDGGYGSNNSGSEAAVTPEIGARVFFGGYNEISGTLRRDEPITQSYDFSADGAVSFDVAYRHHDLFGRHVVGSVFLQRQVSTDAWEAGAELALPLSRASALKLRLEQERTEWRACLEPCDLEKSRSTTSRVGLSWLRDTTDDPFAPHQGSRLVSTLSLSATSARYAWDVDPSSVPDTPTPGAPPVTWIGTTNGSDLQATLAGRRYWPVSTSASVGLGTTLAVGRYGVDGVITQGTSTRTGRSWGPQASGTAEVELIGTPRAIGRGSSQLWWALKASAWGNWRRTNFDDNPPREFDELEASSGRARLSFALAARGRWGLARLELTYDYEFRSQFEYR